MNRRPGRLPILASALVAALAVGAGAGAIVYSGIQILSRSSRVLVDAALPEDELASRAKRHFEHVETVADPHEALARAREVGGPVLVTGSLYLLADLYS